MDIVLSKIKLNFFKDYRYLIYFTLTILSFSGCISKKEYINLKNQNARLTNTLIQNRAVLADSKLNFSKLMDSLSNTSLKFQNELKKLQNSQTKLEYEHKTLKDENNFYKQKSSELESKINASKEKYEKKLSPFKKLSAILSSRQNKLTQFHDEIKKLLENTANIKYDLRLINQSIEISLSNEFLFNEELDRLTENGAWVVFLIAEVMKADNDLLFEFNCFDNLIKNEKKNWERINRRAYSVILAVKQKNVKDSNIIYNGKLSGQTNKQTTFLVRYSNEIIYKTLN